MTAACLLLLYTSGNPIWPWSSHSATKLLVEAFPAAQLRQWKLPHQGYNGRSAGAVANRAEIVDCLAQKLCIVDRGPMMESADALDAVLCAFGAIAVSSKDKLAAKTPAVSTGEGWIAVYQ